MNEMYLIGFVPEQIQPAADEIIHDHGDNAFAVAQKQINACNSRGDFSTAESWVIICRRIRELQAE